MLESKVGSTASIASAAVGGMATQQQTVAAPVECQGVGLHSGQQTQVRILPGDVKDRKSVV